MFSSSMCGPSNFIIQATLKILMMMMMTVGQSSALRKINVFKDTLLAGFAQPAEKIEFR